MRPEQRKAAIHRIAAQRDDPRPGQGHVNRAAMEIVAGKLVDEAAGFGAAILPGRLDIGPSYGRGFVPLPDRGRKRRREGR